MRAMIMAAGRGTRMRPLTDTVHKALIKVGNETLIDRHIKKLAEAGIHDIVINVSYLAEQIQEHLGDGKNHQVTIRYSVENQPLEVGGGLINALPLLGSDPFVVINCDVCCEYPYKNLHENLKKAFGRIVLVENPEHNLQGDFSLNGSKVELLSSKNSAKNSIGPSFTYAGIAIYHPDLFLGFPRNQPQAMLPILQKAIAADKLTGEFYNGFWTDVGTPGRLAEL